MVHHIRDCADFEWRLLVDVHQGFWHGFSPSLTPAENREQGGMKQIVEHGLNLSGS